MRHATLQCIPSTIAHRRRQRLLLATKFLPRDQAVECRLCGFIYLPHFFYLPRIFGLRCVSNTLTDAKCGEHHAVAVCVHNVQPHHRTHAHISDETMYRRRCCHRCRCTHVGCRVAFCICSNNYAAFLSGKNVLHVYITLYSRRSSGTLMESTARIQCTFCVG